MVTTTHTPISSLSPLITKSKQLNDRSIQRQLHLDIKDTKNSMRTSCSMVLVSDGLQEAAGDDNQPKVFKKKL